MGIAFPKNSADLPGFGRQAEVVFHICERACLHILVDPAVQCGAPDKAVMNDHFLIAEASNVLLRHSGQLLRSLSKTILVDVLFLQLLPTF